MFDLRDTFDTVDHDIQLRRLEISFGILGSALEWIFLPDSDTSASPQRYGYVYCLSGYVSVTIDCGVLQGSVQGPILFLVYTFDFVESVVSLGLLDHAHLYWRYAGLLSHEYWFWTGHNMLCRYSVCTNSLVNGCRPIGPSLNHQKPNWSGLTQANDDDDDEKWISTQQYIQCYIYCWNNFIQQMWSHNCNSMCKCSHLHPHHSCNPLFHCTIVICSGKPSREDIEIHNACNCLHETIRLNIN